MIYINFTLIIYFSEVSKDILKQDPLLILLISIPITLKLSNQLQQIIKKRYLTYKMNTKLPFYKIDIKVRLLVEFFMVKLVKSDYSKEMQKIFYLGIIATHLSQC